jgi:hypothetical protein
LSVRAEDGLDTEEKTVHEMLARRSVGGAAKEAEDVEHEQRNGDPDRRSA